MKHLWNEGRVVGYSAYELYVRQHMVNHPDVEPPSEKEWLASTLGSGASMLLQIGEGSRDYIDVELPESSNLCASSVIMASYFYGTGKVPEDSKTYTGWATKVTSYGPLIPNSASDNPLNGKSPDIADVNAGYVAHRSKIREYMKIVDGVVIQSGTWVTTSSGSPKCDLKPELTKSPKLRIYLEGTVSEPFFVVFTGFLNRIIVSDITDTDGSTNTKNPESGDFLGPAVFPWSSKIIFSVQPAFISDVQGTTAEYARAIPRGTDSIEVASAPIIDLYQALSSDTNYYDVYGLNGAILTDIISLNVSTSTASVLAAYSYSSDGEILPPALYGAILDGPRPCSYVPIDTLAPGNIKMYHGDLESSLAKDMAYTTEKCVRDVHSFIRDPETYTVHEIDQDTSKVIPVAHVYNTGLLDVLTIAELVPPIMYVEGSYPRAGVTPKSYSGEEFTGNWRPPFDIDPSDWYVQLDNDIADQYPNAVDGKISGSEVLEDILPFVGINCLAWKRVTGRLSDKIQAECGYDVLVNGDLNPVFKSGGIWPNVNRNMVDSIPESERDNYYVIIPGNWYDGAHHIAWPVRKSDNIIDVTVRYTFQVIVNGKAWNIPPFYNDVTKSRNSRYLGSWWDAANVSQDKKTTDFYANGWAKIHIDGEIHPTAYGELPSNSTGQVYYGTAMLPKAGVYEDTIASVFGKSVLTKAGILSQYHNLSVAKFLQTALYTDMGTGETLPSTHDNILQSQAIYTNGKSSDGTYNTDNIVRAFDLTVANTSANSGKTQLMKVPNAYLSISETDPIASIIQAGRLQSLALSMADINGTPFSLYGVSGTMNLPSDGDLTWYQLITALSEDKSLNVLGDTLKGIRSNISGSGKNYVEFADSSDNPIRLYVSRTEPTDGDIPDGSIGIGW